MKKKIGLLIAIILFAFGMSFLGAWLMQPRSANAVPNIDIAITSPPTYCQEGNWTIGDWTYIGERCVNLPTPTPNQCYRSDFRIADPWIGEEFKWIPYVPDIKLNAKDGYSWQKLTIGNCTYWIEGYARTIGGDFVEWYGNMTAREASCKYQKEALGIDCWLPQPIPTITPTPTSLLPWEGKTPTMIRLPQTWYFDTGMTLFRDSLGDVFYYHDDVRAVGMWIFKDYNGNWGGIAVLPDLEYKQ